MPALRPPAAPCAGSTADAPAGAAISRCFVALWPDASARQQLAALTLRLQEIHVGSRRIDGRDLHLTLAFIGALEAAQAPRVARMLQQICAPRFSWTLDRLGGFAGARVLWAGGGEEPRLAALALAVRNGLDALLVGYDRKAFAPHVTLLRSVTQAPSPPACEAIAWRVSSPVLVVSQAAGHGHGRYRRWREEALR
ncbi:2'-5' RNA ligase [Burkholderiales bacterium]|nr:2'-5' RNA ligase [Burkholderiales bacterium]